MPEQITLGGLIREVLIDYPDTGHDTVAIEVMTRLKVPVKAAKVLVPAVAAQVELIRRAETRDVERRAFRMPWKSDRKLLTDDPVDMILARKELLTHSFPLGDGRWIVWGEATADEHRERIELLAKTRAGISRTISAHESAISRIETAGVSCLSEIDEVT